MNHSINRYKSANVFIYAAFILSLLLYSSIYIHQLFLNKKINTSDNIFSEINYMQATPVEIEIETGTDSTDIQTGYRYRQLGHIRFTKSAAQVGLHKYLADIKKDSATGKALVNSLQDKRGAIVWEVARLKSEGNLVLPQNIFGYMDKKNYHSGIMALNHDGLQYIIIDIMPITHETPIGEYTADLKNIMAHEAIHAVLPNRRLLREFKYGRVLHELFTVFYTNQIREERNMPLRITYGDPTTALFDDIIRQALKSKLIQKSDLSANLQDRLEKIKSNPFYEPSNIEDYGISNKIISLLDSHNLLSKHGETKHDNL